MNLRMGKAPRPDESGRDYPVLDKATTAERILRLNDTAYAIVS